jgi:hypothetical protein
MDGVKSIKIGIIAIVVTGLLLVVPSQQQQVQASPFQDGQNQAEQDFMSSNGQNKDPSCSPENGVDYCTAYKLGYEAKWAHMWIVFDCSSGECR